MSKHEKQPFLPLNVAVLTSSDTRTAENDTSGDTIVERLQTAGHKVVDRTIVKDDTEALRARIMHWIEDEGIDIIITTGGTGLTRRDVMPEVVGPLLDKEIPGFGELFRMLSYEEIGTSTIESRAFAGIAAGGTVIFCVPGSTGACRTAMDKIILPQIDRTIGPCNLVGLLPRIRHE